jgi:hypothetical protein
MLFQLCVIVVMEAPDGGFLNGPIHPLDLSVGLGVFHLSQTMLDAVIVADPVEDVLEGISVAGPVGELDAIIGQDGMNGVRHGRDQIAQELSGIHLTGFGIEFCEGELGCPVNRYEEIELALGRLHLSNVDVEITDWVALKLLLRLFVAFHLRQA